MVAMTNAKAGAQSAERGHTAFQKRVKEFLAHVERTYGVSPAEYRALYRAQGGVCYVCRVATGPTKKNPNARFLGVDHDHLTGEVHREQGCEDL
jgi:hypothetical protein